MAGKSRCLPEFLRWVRWAIGGIPFFGGYISKTLLHESIVEYAGGIGFTAIEWIFLLSGGMTVAYMTKLFLAIFVEQNEDREKQKKFDAQKHYMNAESTFALGGSALVLLLWGLFPHQIMDRTAALGQSFFRLEEAGERVSYFSLKNLSGGGISILIGAMVYILLIRGFLMQEESAAEKRTTLQKQRSVERRRKNQLPCRAPVRSAT